MSLSQSSKLIVSLWLLHVDDNEFVVVIVTQVVYDGGKDFA